MSWEAGRNFLMGQGIFYVMGVIALLGLVCITLLYVVGGRLYKRALKPDRNKGGYIGVMCREFEKQLAGSGNVNNVDNFVNNYLSINKFGIISLVSLDWFCGQLVYLCLLIGIVCGGLGYIWKMDFTQCLNISLFGAGLFGILLCIRKIANYGAKMEKVRLNLTAYFENKVIPEHFKEEKEKSRAADREGEDRKRADKRAKRAERLMEEAQNEKRKLDSSQDKQGIIAAGEVSRMAAQKGNIADVGEVSGKSTIDAADSEVGAQAKLLVQMNAVREFAQKTMENEKEKIREASVRAMGGESDRENIKEVGTGSEKTAGQKGDGTVNSGQAEMESGIRETAATIIRPLERESTRKTSQALTEKEEKIIADILKEYVKQS